MWALIFSIFLWPREPLLQYPCVRAQNFCDPWVYLNFAGSSSVLVLEGCRHPRRSTHGQWGLLSSEPQLRGIFAWRICAADVQLTCNLLLKRLDQGLGHDMGGCKTYAGRKTYRRTRPPEKFSTPPKELLVCSVVDFVQETTEQRQPRGVENVPYEGGSKSPFLEGCHSWGLPPPSFFHPHGVLWWSRTLFMWWYFPPSPPPFMHVSHGEERPTLNSDHRSQPTQIHSIDSLRTEGMI